MIETIELNFNKRPIGFAIPVLALFGISRRLPEDEPLSRISAKWNGARINGKELSRFNRICKIDSGRSISITYPLTLVYPLVQHMLAHKKAPLSLFQVLNTRIHILQHSAIRIDEALDISCETRTPRIRPKGLELDISYIVKCSGETRWEGVLTFYYRGQFGKPDESYQPPEFSPIVDGDLIGEWFLSSEVGFRFAGISGDWNGIHYSKRYARILGFERDFAQPLLVLAKAADYLIDIDSDKPIAMDVLLKGQLYYDRNVTLKGIANEDGKRFEVYSDGNPRPSMNGRIVYSGD